MSTVKEESGWQLDEPSPISPNPNDRSSLQKENAMRTSIWARVAGIGLVACAIAALAAPASGQILHRDGSKAVPFVAEVGNVAGPTAGAPALRRDGSKAVPFVADLEPHLAAPSADGFHWRDAAIGAGGAMIALLAIVCIRAVRVRVPVQRRTRSGAAST
jgi:hypothetical protein